MPPKSFQSMKFASSELFSGNCLRAAQFFVFEVSEIRNVAEIAAILQAIDQSRERELSLAFEDVDVRAHVFERGLERIAVIVAGVVVDEWTTDDDLDVRIVLANELDHLGDGQIDDIEGCRDGDAERISGGDTR